MGDKDVFHFEEGVPNLHSDTGDRGEAHSDGDLELGALAVPSPHLTRPMHRRTSSKSALVTDFSSGKEEVRTQFASIRSEHFHNARRPKERRQAIVYPRSLFSRKLFSAHSTPDLFSSSSAEASTQTTKHGLYLISSRNFSPTQDASTEQYCLQKVQPPSKKARLLRWLGFGGTVLSIYDNAQTNASACLCCGIDLNLIVVNFFLWIFRQTFVAVIITAMVGFLFLTMLFALFIWIAGVYNPECVGGVDFATNGNNYFTDAFILSWTTFATVGYGAIYAAIPTTPGHCVGMSIVCATEGFVGVLFASMCSAVFFAKVSRIQSFAQVDFSDVICVRYGYGVKDDEDALLSTSRRTDTEDMQDQQEVVKLPCPILEFRLVNRMHNISGGEIVDSRVNVVASIDATNLNRIVSSNYNTGRSVATKRRKRGGQRIKQMSAPGGRPPFFPGISERPAARTRFSVSSSNIDVLFASAENDVVDIPRTVLTKIPCESLDHPFLKRAFTIRHKLDEHSPLLKMRPRLMVVENDGYWPLELNNAAAVRDAIQFDQLIIRLTGVSNADASTVFSHTVYDLQDLRVGYQFTNMLYRCPRDGALQADVGRLNDIYEQDGGGGEVISQPNVHKVRDMSVLL